VRATASAAAAAAATAAPTAATTAAAELGTKDVDPGSTDAPDAGCAAGSPTVPT